MNVYSPAMIHTSFPEDDVGAMSLTRMLSPNHRHSRRRRSREGATKSCSQPHQQQQMLVFEDLEVLSSLKPRARTFQPIYPCVSDFLLEIDDNLLQEKLAEKSFKQNSSNTCTSSHDSSKSSSSEVRAHASSRSSLSSIQSLPTTGDCSAEDLEAIHAALMSEEEEEEKSSAYIQQLMQQEEAPAPSVTVMSEAQRKAQRQRMRREEFKAATAIPKNKEEKAKIDAARKDLIYQLFLELDEVGDVKAENWALLAPFEINKLEVLSYDATKGGQESDAADDSMVCQPIVGGDCCQDTCLVCQSDYKHKDSLRKLGCSHMFHRECIDPWLMKHDFCPICRKAIDEA